MSSLIQAKDLEVNRQGKDILQNVSIDIKKKDFITIIGPNGAGKSVLLECLMGTFRPDKGEIEKKNLRLKSWRVFQKKQIFQMYFQKI